MSHIDAPTGAPAPHGGARARPPACRRVQAFGATTVVDGVDRTVPADRFFELVGPSGAGKTTTLSMAV